MPRVPSPESIALPRLFVVGDSISLHYGPYLERLVAGRYAYGRKEDEAPGVRSGATADAAASGATAGATAGATTGATAGATAGATTGATAGATSVSASSLDYPHGAFGENAGDSSMVLTYLSTRPLAARTDVLLLNCGLHDLKVDTSTGRHQVELASYRANLAEIIALARAAETRLVWCSITPVADAVHAEHGRELAFSRSAADVTRYNAAASEVMRAADVSIIDLHAATIALGALEPGGLPSLYLDHVHYLPWVRAAQAAYLAGWLVGRHAS